METTTGTIEHLMEALDELRGTRNAVPHRILISPAFHLRYYGVSVRPLSIFDVPAEVVPGQQEDFILDFATPQVTPCTEQ